MPPYDPYVLKANALSFSGLNVQLAEGELTALKDSDSFKMDARGFSVDQGVTNTLWADVATSGILNDYLVSVVPADAEFFSQATTLQLNNQVAVLKNTSTLTNFMTLGADESCSKLSLETKTKAGDGILESISHTDLQSNVLIISNTPDATSTHVIKSEVSSQMLQTMESTNDGSEKITKQTQLNLDNVFINHKNFDDPANTITDTATLHKDTLIFTQHTEDPDSTISTSYGKTAASISDGSHIATLNTTQLSIEDETNVLTINNAGVTYTPNFTTVVPWSQILISSGVPDAWLRAVVDNASYNTSTLALVDTVHLDDGTADNVMTISTSGEPAINMTQAGTGTTKWTSTLNRTSLSISDVNTDGEFNNANAELSTQQVFLNNSTNGTQSHTIGMNVLDLTFSANATEENGDILELSINPTTGYSQGFISGELYNGETILSSSCLLTPTSITSSNNFNDGSSASFIKEFAYSADDLLNTLKVHKNNITTSDDVTFTTLQSVGEDGGFIKSKATLTSYSGTSETTSSITLTAVDSEASISIPTIKLDDGAGSTTTMDSSTITLIQPGTSTSAISSTLNNNNLAFTDANTDGLYNNATGILNTTSLNFIYDATLTSENSIALNSVDAILTINASNNDELNIINLQTDGLYRSYSSADTFSNSEGIFNKTRLSSVSTYNDGSDALTALTDSFEFTSLYSNMIFNMTESNPISNDSSSLQSVQQISKNNDGIYKSSLGLTAFNAGTNVTNTISMTALDSQNSISIPTIKLDVTGTTTSKPSGYFSTGELNFTDLNTDGAYNNSKTTVLSNNLSITRTTDGINNKTISMNNTSGYTTSFCINENDTNADQRIVTIDTGLINIGQVLTSLHQTNYANVSPSLINSISTFNDETNNSVTKSLSYTNNTSTNSFTLQGSNPFTENSATFTSVQRVSVGDDDVYNSTASVQYYNASTNTTNAITLSAIDSQNGISKPTITIEDSDASTTVSTDNLNMLSSLHDQAQIVNDVPLKIEGSIVASTDINTTLTVAQFTPNVTDQNKFYVETSNFTDVQKSRMTLSTYLDNDGTTRSATISSYVAGTAELPQVKLTDPTKNVTLNTEKVGSSDNFSVSVVSGKTLTLDVPSGAELKIGAGATSQTADGGFTGLWMRIKIGDSYYKIPLMADLSIQNNSSVINSFILDRLSKNVNALSVTDTYTLLLGKAVISYTGDREYWGPPQDTISTYVNLNNTSYLKLTAFDYVGWDFNSINFTNAGSLVGKIYIALWTDNVLTIRFNVVNTDITSGGNATEYKTTITTNNGSWTYVEVNLADFVFLRGDSAAAKATVFSNIKQFLFATDTNVSNPVYIQYVALKRTA